MYFILSGRAKGNSRGPGWLRVSSWMRDVNVQKFGEDEYDASGISVISSTQVAA